MLWVINKNRCRNCKFSCEASGGDSRSGVSGLGER